VFAIDGWLYFGGFRSSSRIIAVPFKFCYYMVNKGGLYQHATTRKNLDCITRDSYQSMSWKIMAELIVPRLNFTKCEAASRIWGSVKDAAASKGKADHQSCRLTLFSNTRVHNLPDGSVLLHWTSCSTSCLLLHSDLDLPPASCWQDCHNSCKLVISYR
jgi:hypothetical protein